MIRNIRPAVQKSHISTYPVSAWIVSWSWDKNLFFHEGKNGWLGQHSMVGPIHMTVDLPPILSSLVSFYCTMFSCLVIGWCGQAVVLWLVDVAQLLPCDWLMWPSCCLVTRCLLLYRVAFTWPEVTTISANTYIKLPLISRQSCSCVTIQGLTQVFLPPAQTPRNYLIELNVSDVFCEKASTSQRRRAEILECRVVAASRLC